MYVAKLVLISAILQAGKSASTASTPKRDDSAKDSSKGNEGDAAVIADLLQNLGDTPAQALGAPVLVMSKSPGSEETPEKNGLRRAETCNPEDVILSDYPQWQAEKGYWIGEYTFYQADGTPFVSSGWPYPYDAYRGFITGNVEGNKYRQRNVFLYPPQRPEVCEGLSSSSSSNDVDEELSPDVVGEGECGRNGNSLVFFADQAATTCSDNEETKGDIEGPFGAILSTTTELIGADNALLYQVFFDPLPGVVPKAIFQSQLTTITYDPDTDTTFRTRTAQGLSAFAPPIGAPTYASFYRERKVDKVEFYHEQEKTIDEYGILDSDLCFRNGGNQRLPVDGYTPGFGTCEEHLESSFDLE